MTVSPKQQAWLQYVQAHPGTAPSAWEIFSSAWDSAHHAFWKEAREQDIEQARAIRNAMRPTPPDDRLRAWDPKPWRVVGPHSLPYPRYTHRATILTGYYVWDPRENYQQDRHAYPDSMFGTDDSQHAASLTNREW